VNVENKRERDRNQEEGRERMRDRERKKKNTALEKMGGAVRELDRRATRR